MSFIAQATSWCFAALSKRDSIIDSEYCLRYRIDGRLESREMNGKGNCHGKDYNQACTLGSVQLGCCPGTAC